MKLEMKCQEGCSKLSDKYHLRMYHTSSNCNVYILYSKIHRRAKGEVEVAVKSWTSSCPRIVISGSGTNLGYSRSPDR